MLNATIAGNVGKDAETRNAGSTTVTGFSIAVEQRGKDGKKTQWIDCSIWGGRGEKVAQYITKGSKVCAAGELTTREYNGKTYLDLNVSDFTFMGGGRGAQQDGEPAGHDGYGAGGNADPGVDNAIPF